MINRDAAEYQALNDRQQEQADTLAEIAVKFGMFDQSTGANGAHYAPAAANPFKNEGLMCGNCVFFNEANNQCQIVEGTIEAEAVCKLWVIPETLLARAETMSELETREVEFRLDATQERTITGLAVPYGQVANIGPYEERFAPGAIQNIDGVKLFYGHTDPIGKVISGRETSNGYEITAKLTEGVQRADETLALMRDGVLNKFSVGFMPVEQTRDGNVVTRTLVDLKEVSVVPFPAFSGAEITQVREEQNPTDATNESEAPMSENIDLAIGAVQDEVAEIRRSVEALTVATPTALALPEFRSYGEFVQAYARGDEAAFEFAQRAASTSADAALRPGFLGAIDNLIRRVRVTANAFSIAALPANGLTVEYARVNTNTIATGKQTTENTALTDGNIAWNTVSANVATYGSQTSVSRQFIERATIDTLGGIFTALAIGYAKKTNDDVVATLAGLTWTSKTFDASALTTAAVIGALADGSAYIFANSGMSPEFIVCDPTAYKKLITIVDTTGRPVVLQTGPGVNNAGEANLAGLTGSIAGIPVLVDPALAANTAYLANSMALQSLESAGAPVRLTNDVSGVNTLSNTYAVYGYGVFSTVPFEGAVVKIKVV
jgi:hypothetical protein